MESFPEVTTHYYNDIQQDIRSGDILLCSGSSLFSNLIKTTTGSVWSHVAFLLRVEPIDRIMVLESVESIGVRTIPLTSYIRDYNGTHKGYPGKLMLARHSEIQEENIPNLSKKAVDLLGYPYRQEEIVHIAARLTMHSLGFADAKPDQKHERAFICSEYAQTCFSSIGIDFVENEVGFIAPVDFIKNPFVKPLCFLHTESLASEPVPLHTITDAVAELKLI